MAKTHVPSSLGAPPPNLDDHKADLDRLEAEQDAARPRLLDCLDPTVAKSYEDRKDLFEWRIQVKLFRAAVGKNHAHMQEFDEKVVAQSSQDAWAFFCDKIGEWPSSRDLKPIITQLKKRTLRADDRD